MRDEHSHAPARHRAPRTTSPSGPARRSAKLAIGLTVVGTVLATTGAGVVSMAPAAWSDQGGRITASADAYVSSASPAQRHGWSKRLVVKRDEARSLLRYNLPKAPRGQQLQATLVLTRLANSSPGTIRVSSTAGGWTEAVKYTNAPAPGRLIATVADNGRSRHLRIDVSRAVQTGGQINLVLTRPTGNDGAVFGSRESGESQSTLQVKYKPRVSPTPGTSTSPTATPSTTSSTTAPSAGLAPSWDLSGSYRLTFGDEFNDTAVDTSKWERGWFKEGISDGVNTNNLQCYDSQQVSESGGYLNLTLAQRQAFCRGSTKQYVSGLVNTRKSFTQRLGSYEARVCLPDGNGDGRVDGFPAWWTNGTTVAWPEHGEIDIVEGIGGGTKASLHYTNPEYHSGFYSSAPLAGCHLFGSKWTSSGVTFYYDGKQLWSRAFNGPYTQYVIFNYAIRPHSGEAIIPGTSVRVDWVRVWA